MSFTMDEMIIIARLIHQHTVTILKKFVDIMHQPLDHLKLLLSELQFETRDSFLLKKKNVQALSGYAPRNA